MAREGRGLICLALTPERCDELGLDLMAAKNESAVRDRVHGLDRGARRRHHRHLRRRPRAHDRGRDRPARVAARPRPARPRLPAQGQGRRRARAHRPDRGGRRPRAARRPHAGRRDLRDHERRRDDGPRARPRALLRAPRPEDDHGRRPDRLPAPPRQARRARRRDAAARPASASSRAVGYRSLVDDKHHVAMVKGEVDGRRRRARPRALRVPDRRRLPLAALRLRRAARVGARDDRGGGPRRAALPRPGGARDRAAQQAARLQPAGPGLRHGRREPRARAARSTCATTASARRSSSTSGCRASASSPTTRRRSAGSRATGCRSPSRCRSCTRPTRTTRQYLRAKRDRMGHAIHHQALPLDEEMLHAEHERDRELGRRAAVSDAPLRDRGRPLLRGPRRAAGRRRPARVRGGGRRGGRRLRRARARSSCRWRRSTSPRRGRYAGVACLGAVIRGETDHYDYVCAEAARGIQDVQLRDRRAVRVRRAHRREHGAGARARRRRQARPGRARRAGGARAGRAARGARPGGLTPGRRPLSGGRSTRRSAAPRPASGSRCAPARAGRVPERASTSASSQPRHRAGQVERGLDGRDDRAAGARSRCSWPGRSV